MAFSTMPRFSGTDPVAWILDIESIMFNVQIHPAHYVEYAMQFLEGEALTWARPRELLFLEKGWNYFVSCVLWQFEKPYNDDFNGFSCSSLETTQSVQGRSSSFFSSECWEQTLLPDIVTEVPRVYQDELTILKDIQKQMAAMQMGFSELSVGCHRLCDRWSEFVADLQDEVAKPTFEVEQEHSTSDSSKEEEVFVADTIQNTLASPLGLNQDNNDQDILYGADETSGNDAGISILTSTFGIRVEDVSFDHTDDIQPVAEVVLQLDHSAIKGAHQANTQDDNVVFNSTHSFQDQEEGLVHKLPDDLIQLIDGSTLHQIVKEDNAETAAGVDTLSSIKNNRFPNSYRYWEVFAVLSTRPRSLRFIWEPGPCTSRIINRHLCHESSTDLPIAVHKMSKSMSHVDDDENDDTHAVQSTSMFSPNSAVESLMVTSRTHKKGTSYTTGKLIPPTNTAPIAVAIAFNISSKVNTTEVTCIVDSGSPNALEYLCPSPSTRDILPVQNFLVLGGDGIRLPSLLGCVHIKEWPPPGVSHSTFNCVQKNPLTSLSCSWFFLLDPKFIERTNPTPAAKITSLSKQTADSYYDTGWRYVYPFQGFMQCLIQFHSDIQVIWNVNYKIFLSVCGAASLSVYAEKINWPVHNFSLDGLISASGKSPKLVTVLATEVSSVYGFPISLSAAHAILRGFYVRPLKFLLLYELQQRVLAQGNSIYSVYEILNGGLHPIEVRSTKLSSFCAYYFPGFRGVACINMVATNPVLTCKVPIIPELYHKAFKLCWLSFVLSKARFELSTSPVFFLILVLNQTTSVSNIRSECKFVDKSIMPEASSPVQKHGLQSAVNFIIWRNPTLADRVSHLQFKHYNWETETSTHTLLFTALSLLDVASSNVDVADKNGAAIRDFIHESVLFYRNPNHSVSFSSLVGSLKLIFSKVGIHFCISVYWFHICYDFIVSLANQYQPSVPCDSLHKTKHLSIFLDYGSPGEGFLSHNESVHFVHISVLVDHTAELTYHYCSLFNFLTRSNRGKVYRQVIFTINSKAGSRHVLAHCFADKGISFILDMEILYRMHLPYRKKISCQYRTFLFNVCGGTLVSLIWLLQWLWQLTVSVGLILHIVFEEVSLGSIELGQETMQETSATAITSARDDLMQLGSIKRVVADCYYRPKSPDFSIRLVPFHGIHTRMSSLNYTYMFAILQFQYVMWWLSFGGVNMIHPVSALRVTRTFVPYTQVIQPHFRISTLRTRSYLSKGDLSCQQSQ